MNSHTYLLFASLLVATPLCGMEKCGEKEIEAKINAYVDMQYKKIKEAQEERCATIENFERFTRHKKAVEGEGSTLLNALKKDNQHAKAVEDKLLQSWNISGETLPTTAWSSASVIIQSIEPNVQIEIKVKRCGQPVVRLICDASYSFEDRPSIKTMQLVAGDEICVSATKKEGVVIRYLQGPFLSYTVSARTPEKFTFMINGQNAFLIINT